MGANYDFCGYATRNNIKCTDGRTILKDAFKDNDGRTVPLVWNHGHDNVTNVLGHAVLENRSDGVYAYCTFNNTESGRHAKEMVQNGDIKSLSIYANKLKQQGGNVLHGAIREVSLVLAGANPGALIDNIAIRHSDGSITELDDEAVIYLGGPISIETKGEETMALSHAEDGGKTIKDIFDSMTEEQKDVVYFMVGQALEGEADEDMEQSDLDEGDDYVKHNVFEGDYQASEPTLSHSEVEAIFKDARKTGSLKESFLEHAQKYGIENIDILFPDAKTVTPTPDFIKRDTDWVAGVLNETRHTPFSRIKSTAADITADEARARGYVKGNLKKEEVIKLLKRVTTPTTIYKKQKLDRDDIIDITDLDVVAWLKAEMRMMLDEEIARAILIGDGREPESEDKINEENIRPIYKDDDMYAHHVEIPAEADFDAELEAIIRGRKHYEGAGNPTLYTTEDVLTNWLLMKDKIGRRLYETEASLASRLRVSKIVTVPVMEGMTRKGEGGDSGKTFNLVGIIVNLKDYVVGADKGGAVSMFDDFDIDYNQYKYLIETRMSGALTHPKSALVIEKVAAAGFSMPASVGVPVGDKKD